MANWVPIKYQGFYDVPLVFLAKYQNQILLFDCPFLEDVDEFAESYKVYLMPELDEHELPKDWTTLAKLARRYVGEVAVKEVQFDDTRRQAIDAGIFEHLVGSWAAAG
jgi:hypothetical protein